MDQIIVYTWADLDNDISYIEKQLQIDNWIPDYIVGVKRGGLVPAIYLSHILGKPLIMMSCQLRDSRDDQVRLYEVSELDNTKNILVVDDICDSGITMSKIVHSLSVNKFSNIRTSSLYYNTAQNFSINYKSRILNREEDKRWIIFPWERKKITGQ